MLEIDRQVQRRSSAHNQLSRLPWYQSSITCFKSTVRFIIYSLEQVFCLGEASGAGTNLKVRAHVPEIDFSSCPSTFWLYKYIISRFGERFRDGQYSLASFLFAVLLLTVPPCPVICKSGGGHNEPRALWNRLHL